MMLLPDVTRVLDGYRRGSPRAATFRDLVLADVTAHPEAPGPTVLDVGCGRGFDADPRPQAALAARAGQYVGVEPDPDVAVGPVFSAVHRCRLEDAPIRPGTVDVGFAVMVVEHLDDPKAFWDKVFDVLRPGGAFWAFTVDARHPFVTASKLADATRLKGAYLRLLHGRRGSDRYENYPTYYRCNTPADVAACTPQFRRVQTFNLSRPDQFAFYFPTKLRWAGRLAEHARAAVGRPGGLLAVRVEK